MTVCVCVCACVCVRVCVRVSVYVSMCKKVQVINLFPSSPSCCQCCAIILHITIDPPKGAKVTHRIIAQEGEPGNEANKSSVFLNPGNFFNQHQVHVHTCTVYIQTEVSFVYYSSSDIMAAVS